VSTFDLKLDKEEHERRFSNLHIGWGEVARYCARVAFFLP